MAAQQAAQSLLGECCVAGVDGHARQAQPGVVGERAAGVRFEERVECSFGGGGVTGPGGERPIVGRARGFATLARGDRAGAGKRQQEDQTGADRGCPPQSNRSRSFSMKPRVTGETSVPDSSANSSSRARCLSVSLVGTSTKICTS